MSKYEKVDLSQVRTYSIDKRTSKIRVENLAKVYEKGTSLANFLKSLPNILKGLEFRELVAHIGNARRNHKPIIFMFGAHVIKVGLSPVLIDMMKHGFITALATHGAGAIHDVELSYFGHTSEDVVKGLADGTFGMVEETGKIINGAAEQATAEGLGYGESLGKRIIEDRPPNLDISLLANAYSLDVPVTLHVALGTDITHQQPTVNGAAIGKASLTDFQIFTRVVSQINEGGVVINCGSSVILPEVFLKALTVARNLFGEIKNFVTANFDMFTHYRPAVNVLQRPIHQGGHSYQFIGHHEIMIPLLAASLKENLLP
ncbi:MAG: hypothetical protein D6813_06320 [Calditrichaeota bacterium]|nr:MAG: hypothetical protein D6813_06320 [Calditrichota bacterium]